MYLSTSSHLTYVQVPLAFVLFHACVIVLHGVISSNSVVLVIPLFINTQFDHPSVSDPAMITKPFAAIHHFVMGVYPYCPHAIVVPAIPANDLLVFGSAGILDNPAPRSWVEIPLNPHAVVGKPPLSI